MSRVRAEIKADRTGNRTYIKRLWPAIILNRGRAVAATSGRADVLPSGRNFFGVDERMLPTKVAYELGSTLADQVITDFIKEEGHYPESIGIVLWAGSNTRSHGQCLGQFMNLIGGSTNLARWRWSCYRS